MEDVFSMTGRLSNSIHSDHLGEGTWEDFLKLFFHQMKNNTIHRISRFMPYRGEIVYDVKGSVHVLSPPWFCHENCREGGKGGK